MSGPANWLLWRLARASWKKRVVPLYLLRRDRNTLTGHRVFVAQIALHPIDAGVGAKTWL